ncbi:MAG: ElyC/SanA/YdcF family protein [Solirubrobacteraceae bacterium]|nr:ElyC/SanA/YdcF family protein [Solirubrobacteraceae bacterium]
MRKRLILLAVLGLGLLFGGRLILLAAASGTPDATERSALAAVPADGHRAAIVFGAGLNRDGEPSLLLRDRLRAAEGLLRTGRVDLLLITGDNSRDEYDEPGAMLAQLDDDGVARSRIAVDYGGRRTWDSCVRARSIFGIKNAVVVTNDFHRARTVVTCRAAGIEVDGAVGTPTGRYPLRPRTSWRARELLASWRGGIDAWVRQPSVPVRGEKIDAYDPCAVWSSLSPEDRGGKPSGC